MDEMASATTTAPATTATTKAPPVSTTSPKTAAQRIGRLSTASLNRIFEPHVDVPGEVGDGQALPDELLSIADLPEILASLSPEQKRTLAREGFGSIVAPGVRFESVLMAGFSVEIVSTRDLTDPRGTYFLHE